MIFEYMVIYQMHPVYLGKSVVHTEKDVGCTLHYHYSTITATLICVPFAQPSLIDPFPPLCHDCEKVESER